MGLQSIISGRYGYELLNSFKVNLLTNLTKPNQLKCITLLPFLPQPHTTCCSRYIFRANASCSVFVYYCQLLSAVTALDHRRTASLSWLGFLVTCQTVEKDVSYFCCFKKTVRINWRFHVMQKKVQKCSIVKMQTFCHYTKNGISIQHWSTTLSTFYNIKYNENRNAGIRHTYN